ncbi:hypothetical protein CSKR_202985 [Clonorchis sinensis]|uniref:Uncharacterized protein n=1 Tax=Clonorchis sinensis TaxID=79923 RepID=A0A8T1M5U8_CLOSI|nr:hypothetical protein CSKR_202985 [Clonorchis sinensis]
MQYLTCRIICVHAARAPVPSDIISSYTRYNMTDTILGTMGQTNTDSAARTASEVRSSTHAGKPLAQNTSLSSNSTTAVSFIGTWRRRLFSPHQRNCVVGGKSYIEEDMKKKTSATDIRLMGSDATQTPSCSYAAVANGATNNQDLRPHASTSTNMRNPSQRQGIPVNTT